MKSKMMFPRREGMTDLPVMERRVLPVNAGSQAILRAPRRSAARCNQQSRTYDRNEAAFNYGARQPQCTAAVST